MLPLSEATQPGDYQSSTRRAWRSSASASGSIATVLGAYFVSGLLRAGTPKPDMAGAV
jgi:hypothetical protein